MHAIITAAVPMADVNLKGSWSNFWGAITAGFPLITSMMSFVGVALVVIAVAKWVWERRRQGGAGNHQPLWGALLVGALLVAPTVLLPLLLTILDGVANIGVSVFKAMTAGA